MIKKHKVLIVLILIGAILGVFFMTLSFMTLSDDYTMYNFSLGENKVIRMCYYDSYIWAGLYTSPAKIAKIDPTNPGAPTVYTLSAGHNLAYDICTGGGRVWSSLYSHEIVKMDPSDGSYVIYALGTNNPTSIAYANGYLWIAHDATTTKLTKMDPSDGSYTEYTISGHHDVCSLEYDGEWLWMTGNNPPNGLLAKFNVNNNSYVVKNLNFNPNQAYWDGNYLWIGSWTSPAKLVKYDTSDNTYSTFVMFDKGFNNIREIRGDCNNRLFCTFDTGNPGRVVVVYTNSGKIEYKEFPKTDYSRSICFDDNGYAWVGFFESPASYAKLN